MPRRIVLLGAPASGKGTQAALIAARFELVNLSTGALIRAEQRLQSSLGKAADQHLAGGALLPDHLMLDVMDAWLARHAGDGFVLDGFPRTLPQAQAFDSSLAARRLALDRAVLLEVPRDVLLARVALRLQCDSCGATMRSGDPGATLAAPCPAPGCRGTLGQRADDVPEVFATRLETYRALTAPVVDHYQSAGILARIDGVGTADEVFERILHNLTPGAPERVR